MDWEYSVGESSRCDAWSFCRLPESFGTLDIIKNKAIMKITRGPRSCRLRQIVSRGGPSQFSFCVYFSGYRGYRPKLLC